MPTHEVRKITRESGAFSRCQSTRLSNSRRSWGGSLQTALDTVEPSVPGNIDLFVGQGTPGDVALIGRNYEVFPGFGEFLIDLYPEQLAEIIGVDWDDFDSLSVDQLVEILLQILEHEIDHATEGVQSPCEHLAGKSEDLSDFCANSICPRAEGGESVDVMCSFMFGIMSILSSVAAEVCENVSIPEDCACVFDAGTETEHIEYPCD